MTECATAPERRSLGTSSGGRDPAGRAGRASAACRGRPRPARGRRSGRTRPSSSRARSRPRAAERSRLKSGSWPTRIGRCGEPASARIASTVVRARTRSPSRSSIRTSQPEPVGDDLGRPPGTGLRRADQRVGREPDPVQERRQALRLGLALGAHRPGIVVARPRLRVTGVGVAQQIQLDLVRVGRGSPVERSEERGDPLAQIRHRRPVDGELLLVRPGRAGRVRDAPVRPDGRARERPGTPRRRRRRR